jgi:hypothetical protein
MKPAFEHLINTKPEAISSYAGTTVCKNLILNGMDLSGGNVVTPDLHDSASPANCFALRELRSRRLPIGEYGARC